MFEIMLLLIAGFAGGVVNAVAGGGKLLVLPALVAAGLSPLGANITASVVLLPGATASVWQYRHKLAQMPRKYFWILVPCYTGAVGGMVALQHTGSDTFDKLAPWLILVAVVLFALQPLLHKQLNHPLQKYPRKSLPVIALLLLLLAVYGGYFGGGFGLVFMALLGFTHLKNVYQLAGLKNMAAAGMELLGVVYFSVAGGIDWRTGLIAMVGCFFGGIAGAHWSLKLRQHWLRVVIIAIGSALAVAAFVRAYG